MRSRVLFSQILGCLRIIGSPLRSIGNTRERLGYTRRDGREPRHSRAFRGRIPIQDGLRELWTGNTSLPFVTARRNVQARISTIGVYILNAYDGRKWRLNIQTCTRWCRIQVVSRPLDNVNRLTLKRIAPSSVSNIYAVFER